MLWDKSVYEHADEICEAAHDCPTHATARAPEVLCATAPAEARPCRPAEGAALLAGSARRPLPRGSGAGEPGVAGGDEEQGAGLDDDPRSGRPPKLTEAERPDARKIPLPAPRSLKPGVKRMADEVGKLLRGETVRTLLRTEGDGWKRLRRRSRARRDEGELRAAATERPARGVGRDTGPRQTVRGFFTWHNQCHSLAFPGPIDSHTGIQCFALFPPPQQKPTLVVVDTAPSHPSEDFEEELARWQTEDRSGKLLPPYCPERTLIERLWRKLKDEWLPGDASLTFKTMTAALFAVRRGGGAKYCITFA